MADDPKTGDEDKQAAEAWGRLQPHADRWFDARLDDFIDQNTPTDADNKDDKKDGDDAGTGSGTTGSGGAVGGAGKAVAKAAKEAGFDWGGFFFGKQQSKT